MFWCSLTVCLDVWNLQSFECSHSIICQCCVEWKYFMFCSSELEDSFCFYDKAFLLLPSAICFVDWKSTFCIFMDKLCVFCWIYTILFNNWYYFVGVSPWTLERRHQLSSLKLELVVFVILRPVDHYFWNSPVYRTFRCFAEDYYSGLNFYILCLDIKRLLQWRSRWTGYISAAKIR